MNRKEFFEFSAGLIGGLCLPGIPVGWAQTTVAGQAEPARLDESYLAKGLTGMARAKGWFDAHWGAGVLAGYYLCRDHALAPETTAAIQRQLDVVMELKESQFVPLEEERPDESLIEEVPKAVRPAMEGGLRAHGHAVIFAALATRALRDLPRLAQPRLIEALCGLSRQIARIKPQKPADAGFAYANLDAMVAATFDSLARFERVVGHPSILRPNFTHMVTHTEALRQLERMGYPDLARVGHPGHQSHIHVPVPEIPAANEEPGRRASLESLLNARFWNDEQNQARWKNKFDVVENRNGDWIAAGHLFKVLYSYRQLVAHVADPEKVRVCSAVLLERYLNPEVQGG